MVFLSPVLVLLASSCNKYSKADLGRNGYFIRFSIINMVTRWGNCLLLLSATVDSEVKRGDSGTVYSYIPTYLPGLISSGNGYSYVTVIKRRIPGERGKMTFLICSRWRLHSPIHLKSCQNVGFLPIFFSKSMAQKNWLGSIRPMPK